jgi:multicomponent Na+:H+ antiporter subunit C
MSLVYALAVGILFTVGIYQLLGRDLLRIAFGIYLAFNGANLFIMSVGALPGLRAPFAQLGGPFADPMLQAMVLTAIVIGFGVATFLLMLAARLAQERRSLDAEAMREWRR